MGIDVVTLALAKGYTDRKIRDVDFSNIPLDTSLTKNGQAADAKAVGDRLQSLSDRVNAALDSDDTTLDQMSEVVAPTSSPTRRSLRPSRPARSALRISSMIW